MSVEESCRQQAQLVQDRGQVGYNWQGVEMPKSFGFHITLPCALECVLVSFFQEPLGMKTESKNRRIEQKG
jgi:hypothetical protein